MFSDTLSHIFSDTLSLFSDTLSLFSDTPVIALGYTPHSQTHMRVSTLRGDELWWYRPDEQKGLGVVSHA